MKSITKIGFKNFRVFEQGEFDLKRITLMTGANSSGKSTLFKSLLLLKQNIQANGNLENLTLSNKPYFLGTFETTKNNKNNEDFFSFIFGFNVLPFKLDSYDFDLRIEYMFKKLGENATLTNIIISDKNIDLINVSCDNLAKTIVNEKAIVKLLKEYHKIIELLNNRQFDELINNLNDSKPTLSGIISEYAEFSFSEDSFTDLILGNQPNTSFLELKHKFNDSLGFKVKKETDNTDFDFFKENNEGQTGLNDIAKTIITNDVVLGRMRFNQIFTDKDIYERLSRDAISRLFELQSSVLTPNENIKAFIDYMLNFAERVIPNATQILIDRLKNIEYLSSNRSRLSRYFQNSDKICEFDEIIYEYSQLITSNNSFSDNTNIMDRWLRKFEIGEKIIVERSEGILSYVFIEQGGIKRNIADFGFGIVQLLPILMKISIIAERKREQGTILLIEEPEANLHPKFQSILTELIIETSKEFKIHFIIETHSEYLIRELQIQIANKVLSPDDVAIFYINKSFNENKKQIETIGIDESGKIEIDKFGDEFYKYTDIQEISLLNINRDMFVEQFNSLKQKEEDNEIKISELEYKIDEFTNKLDIQVYQTVINQRFDTSKLSLISIKYLASGQFLLHTIDNNSDFSPAILQYGRTVENELKEIFIAIGITDTKKLMLGKFQGALEKYKNGKSIQCTYSDSVLSSLCYELSNRFDNPKDLKIELLNDIREKRNGAGHSGQMNTKQHAIDYIEKVNEFLDKWINEKKA